MNNDIEKVIDILVEKKNLLSDESSINYHRLEKTDCIFQFESINDMSDIEKYLIYFVRRNSKKDYDLFQQYLDENNSNDDIFWMPVMIFDTWDDENKFYQYINDRLSTSIDRKKMNKLFDSKISIYMAGEDKVTINVDDGINYLEYFDNSSMYNSKMKGFIYNVSFFELKKLFNVTGKNLFEKNIRKGIDKGITIKNIKVEFKNYLKISLFYELSKFYEENKLKSVFGIDEDMFVNYSPRKFWFCHNGITIFSYDNCEFERFGNTIKLNPKKVSVINGAQTLTCFLEAIKNLKEEYLDNIQNIELKNSIVDKEKINIDKLLAHASKRIFLKTIFINGQEDIVQSITCGLNTQVPVLPEDITADSNEVRVLNKILRKANVEIVKGGYTSAFEQGYTPLDFAKKYLLCINQPGKSKNLRKSDLNDIINNAITDFSIRKDKLLPQFRQISEIDKWWKSKKKERDNLYDNTDDLVFCKYGKNYFSSYVLVNQYDEDDYFLAFSDFIKSMRQVSNREITLNDFKKDDLFNNYIEYKNSIVENTCEDTKVITLDYQDLLIYLKENIKSRYSIAVTISDYLSSKKIDIEKFRVINRISEKCCEAFPFPNSVFSEIYQSNIDYDNDKYISFAESKFKESIKQKFSLFILDNDLLENKKREIVKVSFIENFSFDKYEKDAESVYNKTIEAFKQGDERLFPKVSDKLKFHVRPKAIDSNDTFEFSNGNDITKRTFWANRDTLDELIVSFLGESDN